MTIEIETLSAFSDNYIWLIKNTVTKQVAVIDPGDANPILAWLDKHSEWQLSNMLITHHHQDHIGGIEKLKEKTKAKIFAPNASTIPVKDITVTNNQVLSIVGLSVHVISVPGHTLEHVAYYIPKQAHIAASLFPGDTLFSGGCGRVFEGTMEQMYDSVERLNELPPETLVYPAHEYTLSNLKFALAVEPDNRIIKIYLDKCVNLRATNQITLPSTLLIEQQINPFLRCNEPSVIKGIKAKLNHQPTIPTEVFSILREWKNTF